MGWKLLSEEARFLGANCGRREEKGQQSLCKFNKGQKCRPQEGSEVLRDSQVCAGAGQPPSLEAAGTLPPCFILVLSYLLACDLGSVTHFLKASISSFVNTNNMKCKGLLCRSKKKIWNISNSQ